jgi:hypothetical protein
MGRIIERRNTGPGNILKDLKSKAFFDPCSISGAKYLYKLITDQRVKHRTIIPINRITIKMPGGKN